MKLFSAYANVDFSHVKNQFIAVICGNFVKCSSDVKLKNRKKFHTKKCFHFSQYVCYFVWKPNRLAIAIPFSIVVIRKSTRVNWSNNNNTGIMARINFVSWWIFRNLRVLDHYQATWKKSGLLRAIHSIFCISCKNCCFFSDFISLSFSKDILVDRCTC